MQRHPCDILAVEGGLRAIIAHFSFATLYRRSLSGSKGVEAMLRETTLSKWRARPVWYRRVVVRDGRRRASLEQSCLY